MSGYIKTILLALLAIAGILVIVQNYSGLTQEVSLRLNLYLWEGNTNPYPVYLLILLGFLLGIVLASLAGLCDRVRLRKEMKEALRKKDELEKEVYSLRSMALGMGGDQSPAKRAD